MIGKAFGAMKILHIVAGDLSGGAARGAYWLHLGLRESGIDSRILTNSSTTLGYDDVVSISGNKKNKLYNIARSQFDVLPVRFYRNRTKTAFSTGFFGFDFRITEEYRKADIVHLHWINAGFVNVKLLSGLKKPTVWTMRDMWPMTGGCHYALECENYKKGCGSCPQLGSNNTRDLSRWILKRKEKFVPETVKMIGVSKWISGCAKESKIFQGFDIRTIHNCINIREFFPVEKNTAKKVLGFRPEEKIILAGAQNLSAFYKGFDKFIGAIKKLKIAKYTFCFFGRLDKIVAESFGFNYKNFGCLHDNISLRMIYSAADVFVAPSLMDAFGKTLVEAMACGTPVVCFGATGPKDIVDHKINGYLAQPFSSDDLARGIDWVLNSPNYGFLSRKAREKVVREFDCKVIASKYIELYREVLK